MTVLAVIHYFAVDPVAIGYIVIIVAIWLISTIRGIARRTQQRSLIRGRSATAAGATRPTAVPGSQLAATLRAMAQQQVPAGIAIGDVRITTLKRRQEGSGIQKPAAPAAIVPGPPAVADLPTPTLPDALATIVSGDQPQPSHVAASAQAGAPLPLSFPISTASGIASAVIAAAVIGPCAAYRAHADDLIGW